MANAAAEASETADGISIQGNLLDLSCQILCVLPATLGQAVLELNVSFNNLSSLCSLSTTAPPKLLRLNASHNRLIALPSTSAFAKLERLDVSSVCEP